MKSLYYVSGILLALTFLFSHPISVSAISPLTLYDVNGEKHQPLNTSGSRASVFFFIAHDCPISNTYAPEINRICAAYTAKKVAFAIVYTDSDTTAQTEREHARAFGFRCLALHDPQHLLVKRLGITTTPEVAVISPDGKQLYRGRIDNTYARVGIRRNQTTEHDLREALDAILQKHPVPHPTTTAVGCYISPTK
jgi:hypothetical protein